VHNDRGRSASDAKALAWKALRWVKRREPRAARAIYAFRRTVFVARLKLLAAWNGARVQVNVAQDVRFGPGIGITIWPRSQNVVRIGAGSRIDARVLFVLNNGRILFGDKVEIRRDSVFHLWGGTFALEGETSFRGTTSSTVGSRSASEGRRLSPSR